MPLKHAVDPARRITYGIVQCGPNVPDGIPYIRPVDMDKEKGAALGALRRTAPEIAAVYARSTVVESDLVVSIGPSFGKVMIVPAAIAGANLTQGTARVAPAKHVDTRFLFWCLRSQPLHQAWESNCSGATFRSLTLETLAECHLAYPPLEEQRAIADFLDRETSKIDALAAKKERLIELLQEKRTALITHAVTKGLDPNAPMKPSDIDWLGDIPAHWDVKRLWHLTPDDRSIMYGIVLPGPHFDGGVPIVKGGDVSPERLHLDRLNRTTPEIEARYVRSRLRGGDIVYAIRGSIGEAELVPAELTGANLTQDAARIAPDDGVNGSWLLYAVKSEAVYRQLEAGALGATIRGINIRDLKRALIPVPPPNEQQEIAEYLSQRTSALKNLKARIQEGLDRLKEYRTGLISAAVTGKIDVREEVA
ncbi:restriction endonuclease subunit S [Deltaproteobacteria bacterium]|nr:restriction endonuclease subunit S [Deltaproteobacteria bacterium]